MDLFLREQGCFRWGRFTLDPVRRTLTCDGARVKLAERLFDVLLYLVTNHGRVVGRDELLQAVWAGRRVEDSNVGQAIFELRKALKIGGSADRGIVTVPGKGFRFAEPVTFETTPQRDAADLPVSNVTARWRGQMPLGLALLALLVTGLGLAFWAGRARSPGGGHASEAAFAPPGHSVAVLAFDNMSGDQNQAYFSDGLSEQLTDSLTRIDALRVAARTSAFAFKGRSATVGEIARRLNVGAVLEGSVRRQGGRVLITAQLVNALTGYHYWSKTYDRTTSDLLDLQVDIARAVTQSLQVTLLGDEAARLALGGTANPVALDAYLRGVKQQSAGNEAGLRAALAQYDAALALDGGFARARTARAFTLAYLGETGAITDPAALRRVFIDALAEADRALALAPTLGAAHSVRGLILQWGFLDLEGDAAEQMRARELTPGSATVEGNYASAQVSLGRFDEAVAAERYALQLDPMTPDRWGGLGRALYMARRYGEAIAALHHASAVADALPARILFVLGNALLMDGQPEAARAACAAETDWKETQVLAIAYHVLGRQDDAEAALARMQARLGDAGAYNYAVVNAQWGRADQALRWLELAARLRDPGLADMRVNPMLDPVRGQAAFKQIRAALAELPGH